VTDLIERLKAALAGRYVIQRELGRGGMAAVFLAQDLRHHQRLVAIKVLDPELAAAIGPERFLREIEIAARLSHPHILPLLESGAADGLLFYVMPYAEGESLRQRLDREKQLPIADAVRITGEVADALDFAHRRGVVHRDIKPENILLQEQHAVVADFGIARAVLAAGDERGLTGTGVVIGTPACMSPEQTAGQKDLDGRSDQYSLGCVLYEMLAGQPPFTGPTAESLAHQHLNVAPRPVTDLRPAVPDGVARALQRTLAKTPADRFGTTAEFAAAIAGGAESAARPQEPPARPRAHRVRTFALVGSVLVFAYVSVAAWQRWWPFEQPVPVTQPEKKAWLLVAEFDGPADDSSLAVTARDIVSATLDRSAIVATVPPEQIQVTLESAGKPPGTRVDAQLAKELAFRTSVRAVVQGKIGRLGHSYSVILQVVDAESLKVVLTERAAAKSEDALIPTLGRLAEKLREGLGEEQSAIRATRPTELVATPSFEAYRLLARGELREAIALDPDFAFAWMNLGAMYNNLGERDSARAAFNEALRRPRRLTIKQRLWAEAGLELGQGNPTAALSSFNRILSIDPYDQPALFDRASALSALGRSEEALESLRESGRVSPLGLGPAGRNNELVSLCNLGRVDEARKVVRTIPGRVPNARHRMIIEIQAENWPAVERIADTLQAASWVSENGIRADALLALASARAARGAFRSAGETFERAENAGPATAAAGVQPKRARLMLTIASQGEVPLPTDAWTHDTSAAGFITRGLRAAIAGDRIGAQRYLNRARALPGTEWSLHGAAPALLEARIAMLEGRWVQAAGILRPVAAQPREFGFRVPYRVGMSIVRWSLADAYEHLGQPDSAAVVLERITSDPEPARDERHARGILLPFSHRRLVLLYARMGRLEDARRHWEIFNATVRTPDPELQPLIAEARAALASAEGIAKSTRR